MIQPQGQDLSESSRALEASDRALVARAGPALYGTTMASAAGSTAAVGGLLVGLHEGCALSGFLQGT